MDRSIGQVSAWARCVRGLAWIDEALQILSPIVTGALLLGVLSLGWLLMDREPPFRVLSVEPASAAPGETVTLRAKVWRDGGRNCSCAMRRALWDGAGARHDDPTDYFFSAESIRSMGAESPGELRVKIKIPYDAAPGAAFVESDLRYYCNPAHRLAPISVNARMPFTITGLASK